MKKIISCLVLVIAVLAITGCNGKEIELDGPFSIVCDSFELSKDGDDTVKRYQYDFGVDQIAINYVESTDSRYSSEEKYNKAKAEAEKLENSKSDGYYDVRTDDTNKSINISYNQIITSEEIDKKEKDYYKASKVLKRIESIEGTTCHTYGVERNQIKG